MGEWLVRPHPNVGWQVLTPARTQAAAAGGRDEAISKAAGMIGDEGGGVLVVSDSDGVDCERHPIRPSVRPYRRQPEATPASHQFSQFSRLPG